jgi:hypothetical protein
VVTAVYVVAYVPLGFVAATFAKRKAVAATVFIAVMIGLTAFAESIVQNNVFAGGRWVALAAPLNTADAANYWVFGASNPESLLDAANIHPGYGIAALAVVGALGVGLSFYRYRKLM